MNTAINADTYEATKRLLIKDLRFTLQNEPKYKRSFILSNQKDILYYPKKHLFMHHRDKVLRLHNYTNTIRTLEDIRILADGFKKSSQMQKQLNSWFSEIYNLRTPNTQGVKPASVTLSGVKEQAEKIL